MKSLVERVSCPWGHALGEILLNVPYVWITHTEGTDVALGRFKQDEIAKCNEWLAKVCKATP